MSTPDTRRVTQEAESRTGREMSGRARGSFRYPKRTWRDALSNGVRAEASFSLSGEVEHEEVGSAQSLVDA